MYCKCTAITIVVIADLLPEIKVMQIIEALLHLCTGLWLFFFFQLVFPSR
jgi:hypothetical protein